MSRPTGSVTVLIRRLENGDTSVVESLWRHFGPKLIKEAARKMRAKKLRTADEEDIVQCVFVDVVQRIAEQRMNQLEDRRRLWRLMEMSTWHTTVSMFRNDEKTDPDQLLSEDLSPDVCLHEPVPDFFASLEDDLDQLSERIDEHAKTIVLKVLQGYESSEIAEHLGLTPRTIQRKIVTIRDAWIEINSHEHT